MVNRTQVLGVVLAGMAVAALGVSTIAPVASATTTAADRWRRVMLALLGLALAIRPRFRPRG
ncbi:hypothetical protein BH24ACT3_BH24ACT3_16350 [soil metagenome]